MSEADQNSYQQKGDSYSSDSEASGRFEEYPDGLSEQQNSNQGEEDDEQDGYAHEQETFKLIQDQNIINKIKLEQQQIRLLPKHQRCTLDCITKYQYAKVIAVRAQQIALGSPLYIDIPFQDLKYLKAGEIAEKQFESKKIPFIIRRMHPNGECEDWQLSELLHINK